MSPTIQRDAEKRALRSMLLDEGKVGFLCELFSLLGDPTRLRIVDALSRRELCVHDLAQVLGKTISAVSHQLRLLRGARLVRHRREGKLVIYSLDDEHVIRLVAAGLEHVEH